MTLGEACPKSFILGPIQTACSPDAKFTFDHLPTPDIHLTMTATPPPVPLDPTREIFRIDRLLDEQRTLLFKARERDESPQVRGAINGLLDERLKWMRQRDAEEAA